MTNREAKYPDLADMPIEFYRMVKGTEVLRHIKLGTGGLCRISEIKKYIVWLMTQSEKMGMQRAVEIVRKEEIPPGRIVEISKNNDLLFKEFGGSREYLAQAIESEIK